MALRQLSKFAFALLASMCALLVLAPTDAQAQKKGKKEKKERFKYGTTDDRKAHELYQEGNEIRLRMGSANVDGLMLALDKFKAAIERDPRYVEALLAASDIYMDLKQPGNQINCIMQAVGVDSTCWITAYYNCAVALCQKDRFEEALHWFDLFDRFSKGKNIRIKNRGNYRQRARAIVELMKDPVPYDPSYPTPEIAEMPFETYWPSISLDERELVVTARVPLDTAMFNADPAMIARIDNNETHEDLYCFFRDTPESKWKPRTPIYAINSDFNEGTQSISPDGRWMFYTACGYADSKGSCDIYFSQRTVGGWTKGVNIGAPVNSPDWESQPCLSADGKTLLFVRGERRATNRLGNIYMAKVIGVNENGVPRFSAPVSLGDAINTPGDESHPFLHADGKTLFFSSDTWPGLGGKDVFVSRLQDDGTWSQPMNLGYPINNTDDDEGLVVTANGLVGYYNSIRTVDGRRKREVKKFELYPEIRPEPVPFVTGVVTNCDNKRPIEATILLDRMPEGTNVVTARALPDGSFTAALPGEADYILSVNAKGYFFRAHHFKVDSLLKMQGPIRLQAEEVCLEPLKKGKKIELRNIYFDTDKWDIKPESKVELEVLIRVLKENPKIRLEISGHTDNRASVKHNQKLSENRAKSTVDYLVQHGIDRSRFATVGYGLSRPCATNDTEEGRALNRRIEAKIIE